MRKILYISGYQIFPPFTGGHIRAANIIRGLVRAGCEVHIHALGGRSAEYKKRLGSSTSQIEPGITEYVYRGLGRGLIQGLLQRLHVAESWPTFLGFVASYDPDLMAKIAWADTVIINHAYAYTFLRLAKDKLRIINSHNLEQNMWLDTWWQKHLMSPVVKKLEKKAAQTADAVWCCTKEEESFYRIENPHIRPFAVPNGVFPEHYQKSPGIRSAMRAHLCIEDHQKLILFVGSNYAPNRLAVQYLNRFALQHRDFLTASGIFFLIVGGVTQSPRRQGPIITTGYVDQTLPYFQAADFAINPVTTGSGTNVKVFEYIAAHLPLLSTLFGVRGFALEDSRDFFCFDHEDLRNILEKAIFHTSARELTAFAKRAFEKNQSILDIASITAKLTQTTRSCI